MNAKTFQTKDFGGRRSRPLFRFVRGGASPLKSGELDSEGIVSGNVTKLKPWHPAQGPLEQHPRSPQVALSDGAEGAAGAALNCLAVTVFETAAVVSLVEDTAAC